MFYEHFVKWDPKSTRPQLYAKCPLHPDTNASFTVNEDTHEWFCHGCAQGGKEVEFIAAYYSVSKKIAHVAWTQYEERGRLPFPTDEYITACQDALKERPREIAALHSFGISDQVIEELRLGYDDTRITFPIKSSSGQWVNIRKYLPPHRRLTEGNNRKVLNMTYCGENRFYPFEAFREKGTIVIVEGEKDMAAAKSAGYNAITGTSGGAVPMQELAMFQGYEVYIMTDNDTAGNKLAKSYQLAFSSIGITTKRILLPVKDFSEFVQQHHEESIYDYVVTTSESRQMDGPAEHTLLSDSEEVEKLNSWVILENMSVIGTDPKTYTIPTKLRPVCRDQGCQKPCPAQSGVVSIEVDVDSRQLIQFIDSSDNVQDKYLQKMFGCSKLLAEPITYINAQKLLFQESAAFMDGLDSASFEHRYGIYLYNVERLSPTQKYIFECTRVAEPRTQQNYYVIRKATGITTQAIPEVDETDNYIEYFKSAAAGCSDVMDLLQKHYDTWMRALNIEGRTDLFGAIMLTYLSVTEIEWRGGVLKGWLDTMVIGDTRTGKSQMAQRIVKTLKLGGYINGENARATGVIGGVQRMGESWIITWGAIPMNDRGLLIIDEASGLSVDDIKDLSATRSSGAVTISKIAKGEARARTRLLWMSNPRTGKNLEEFYWRGYGAFVEFIPVAEDQARFDLVLTAAREDVPILKGYSDEGPVPPIHHWNSLINFAWSVSRNSIVYGQDLAQYISEAAAQLDEDYGGGPLVVGVAVHEKIIRLTCAIAILCGSIVGDRVILRHKHVDFAMQFLKATYDKPTLDYRNYIQEYKKAQRAREQNTQHVRALVTMYPAMKVLLTSNLFRGNQVREVLGVEATEAAKLISDLLQKGLLKITGSGAYAPDKLLVEIAKQMEV